MPDFRSLCPDAEYDACVDYEDLPIEYMFPEENEVKPQETAAQRAVEEREPPAHVSNIINDGRLSGEGTGKEIVETVAAMLDTEQYYGFEIGFYRIGDEVETPWDTKDG